MKSENNNFMPQKLDKIKLFQLSASEFDASSIESHTMQANEYFSQIKSKQIHNQKLLHEL